MKHDLATQNENVQQIISHSGFSIPTKWIVLKFMETHQSIIFILTELNMRQRCIRPNQSISFKIYTTKGIEACRTNKTYTITSKFIDKKY